MSGIVGHDSVTTRLYWAWTYKAILGLEQHGHMMSEVQD